MFKADSSNSYLAFRAEDVCLIGKPDNSYIILPDHVQIALHQKSRFNFIIFAEKKVTVLAVNVDGLSSHFYLCASATRSEEVPGKGWRLNKLEPGLLPKGTVSRP